MNPIDTNLALWRAALGNVTEFTRRQIRPSLDLDNPPVFYDFMMELFERAAASGASRWLDSNLAVHALTTPALFPLSDALRLASTAARFDVRLDCKILRHITTPPRNWLESASDAEILHVLEVIDSISDCQRLVFFLLRFAKARNPHLQSKAVKLLARACRNPGWATLILARPDARTRANLMEGLALQISPHVEKLLRQGSRDPDPRVAVNALLALTRSGDEASYQTICRLASDDGSKFRPAAQWALLQIRDKPRQAPERSI